MMTAEDDVKVRSDGLSVPVPDGGESELSGPADEVQQNPSGGADGATSSGDADGGDTGDMKKLLQELMKQVKGMEQKIKDIEEEAEDKLKKELKKQEDTYKEQARKMKGESEKRKS